MQRGLRQLIGAGAVLGPALHVLSDILEWTAGGFTPAQLWINYLAFVLIPFVMVGLYGAQRPDAGWMVLVGALLYGAAFIYFSSTTLYALSERIADYAELWRTLGVVYTLHGGVMIAGGVFFAVGSLWAGVLPRSAVLVFAAGLLLNLLFGLLPVPDLWQTIGSTLRNIGLIGMGAALVRGPPRADPV